MFGIIRRLTKILKNAKWHGKWCDNTLGAPLLRKMGSGEVFFGQSRFSKVPVDFEISNSNSR